MTETSVRTATAKASGTTVSKGKGTTTSSTKTTGRAPTKAEQTETAVKLTKAQQASWDSLIKATKDGIAAYLEVDKKRDELLLQGADIKVASVRAVIKLMSHPSMVATRGPKAGTPALTKVATATGYAPSTLEPIFKAATEFIKRGWNKRTGAPKDDERGVVSGIIKSENERKYAQAGNGGGKGKGKGAGRSSGVGTKVTFSTLQGQIKALREATARFTKDNGFTVAQADELQSALDEIHDAIEQSTAGREPAESAA